MINCIELSQAVANSEWHWQQIANAAETIVRLMQNYNWGPRHREYRDQAQRCASMIERAQERQKFYGRRDAL